MLRLDLFDDFGGPMDYDRQRGGPRLVGDEQAARARGREGQSGGFGGPRAGRKRPAPSRLPLSGPGALDERPERADLLQGRISYVLPAQPLRRSVGAHALGAREEQGSGELGAPSDR